MKFQANNAVTFDLLFSKKVGVADNLSALLLYKALVAYGDDKNLLQMFNVLQQVLGTALKVNHCCWLVSNLDNYCITPVSSSFALVKTVYDKDVLQNGFLIVADIDALKEVAQSQFVSVDELLLSPELLQVYEKNNVKWVSVVPVSVANQFSFVLLGYQYLEDAELVTSDVGVAVQTAFKMINQIIQTDVQAAKTQQQLYLEHLKTDVSNIISQSFDTQYILELVAKKLCLNLGFERCIFVQLDTSRTSLPPSQIIVYANSHWALDIELSDITETMVTDGLMGAITYPGLAPKDCSQEWNSFFARTDVSSACVYQITCRGIPLGLMILEHCSAIKTFTQQESMVLKAISVSLGAAIYQNYLFNQEKQAQESLEKESLRKNQYIASLTHELRSPLNNMVTCSTMMKDGLLGALQPKQQQYVELINGSAYHLLEMINDLLDIAKIESGRFELVKSDFDFKAVITDLYLLMVPSLAKKHQELVLDISEDFPDTFYGDSNRLRQVLTNLLTNAHKFSPEKTAIILSAQKITDEDATEKVLITVKDEGPGINPKDLRIIFEPFEQANRTKHVHHKGTGLGLSISRTIVELHEGNIIVDSEENEGSTFTVSLPVLHYNN